MKSLPFLQEKKILAIIQILTGIIVFLPLYTSSAFYFPFVTPRNFAFRILVEIALFFYIILVLSHQKYLPQKHVIWYLLVCFFGALAFSSIIGGDIRYSFWSNFERMEGLITHIHLLIFFFIVLGAFRSYQMWERMIHISVLASVFIALIGLGQMLKIHFLLESSSGERISSTLGNPTYLSSYLLLHFFLLLYLIEKYKKDYIRLGMYILAAVLFIIIILNTETRGALVGIALALVTGYILFMIRSASARWKIGLSFLLISFIAFLFWIFLNTAHPFVEKSDILRKITSISLEDITTQTRIATWKAGFQAFQEKPIFGWGVENFYQAFDKYFPRVIYQQEDSVVWFDRPHNIIVQYVVEGGIIALVFYIGFLGAFLFCIFKKIQNKNTAIIFIMLLVAYIGQNLFVFDSINSFIPFYLILAFMIFMIMRDSGEERPPLFQIQQLSQANAKGVIITAGILVAASIWYMNGIPLLHNRAFASAFIDSKSYTSTQPTEKIFELARDGPYMGTFEIIAVNSERITDFVKNKTFPDYTLSRLVTQAETQLLQAIQDHPQDVRLHIFLMNFYMNNARLDTSFNDKIIVIRDKAAPLSPDRAYIYLLSGRAYMAKGEVEKGVKEFERAVEIAPWVYEPHLHLFAGYLSLKHEEKARKEYETMKEILDFHEDHFKQLAKVYLKFKMNKDAADVLLEGIEKFPGSASLYASLADVYKVMGKTTDAKKAAQKAGELSPSYKDEAEDFIKTLE